MVKQNIYYVFISLYAGLNTMTGLHIIGSFVYMPQMDLQHFTNFVTGVIALSIGIICFTKLTIRRSAKSETIRIRRRLAKLLIFVFLPLLVLSLVINLTITPLLSLYIASVLSVAAAMVTFLLVWRRLHSPALMPSSKR